MAVSISGDGAVTGVASINTDVSSTELGYLDGVTSAIQPQIAGAGGLVLVTPTGIANSGGSASSSGGTTTFTGVSSISLNGVFTSAYENYRVVIRATASDSILGRLRASGVDAASGYITEAIFAYSTTVGANAPYSSGFLMAYVGVSEPSFMEHTISGPYLADYTRDLGLASTADSSTVTALRVLGGVMRNTTQYDGMSLVANSGTLTGTIRVYGYAQ